MKKLLIGLVVGYLFLIVALLGVKHHITKVHVTTQSLEVQIKDLHNEVKALNQERVLYSAFLERRVQILEAGGVNVVTAALHREFDDVEAHRKPLLSFDHYCGEIENLEEARASREQLKGLYVHLLKLADSNSDWGMNKIGTLRREIRRLTN